MFGDSPVDYETDAERKTRLDGYARQRDLIPQMTMDRIAKSLRSQAEELEKYAPAESMYLCSIAHKLEMKVARLTKK